MTSVAEHIRQRYPNSGRQALYATRLAQICQAFADSGIADRQFTEHLTSGSEAAYWARVTEALLWERLQDKTFPERPGNGPDLLVSCGTRRVWIESICPEPSGIPDDWLSLHPNKAVAFPHEAILLRWTGAIKEKAEKLLGSADGKRPGY